MRVIVIGCGQVGATLAYQLYKRGHLVVVIDQNEKAFEHLPDDFQGRAIEGDALTRTVLHRAEVKGSDALFALTNSDPLNALIAYIAHSEYSVPIVAARNNNPRQRELQEALGIKVIHTPDCTVENVIDLLSGETIQVIYLDHGSNIAIYKLEVPAEWAGHNLDELIRRDQRTILKWIRSRSDLSTDETNTLKEGDQIILSAHADMIETMKNRLDSRQEQGL